MKKQTASPSDWTILIRAKESRLLPLFLLPIFSLFLPFLVHGQDEDNESNDETLEELNPFEVQEEDTDGYYSSATTAGTRFAQDLTDVPGTITVINQQMINDVNAWKPERALRIATAGVVSNVGIRTDLQIRGFRQQQQFRDGVQSPNFSTLPMYDIDRMEVVKGPAAMTFGDSSVVGGVVNFVSRKPTMQSTGDIKLTLSDNSFYRLSANASGPIAPLFTSSEFDAARQFSEENNLRYRVTLGHQHDDRVHPLESDDQQFYGGAFSGDFGNTTLNFESYYFKLNGYTYFNDFVDTNAPSPGPIVRHPLSTEDFLPSALEAPNDLDREEFYFKAESITKLSDNRSLKIFYRYRQADEIRRHLRGITFDSDTLILNRQDIPLNFDNDENVIQADYLHSIRHRGFNNTEMTHNVTAGVQYIKQDLGTRLAVLPLDPIDVRNPDFSGDTSVPPEVFPDTYTASNVDVNATETSYYVQTSSELYNDKLIGIAGIRWIRGEDFLEDFNADTVTFNGGPTESVKRLGLIFKPTDRISIYYLDADTFTIQTGVDPDTGVPLDDQEGLIEEVGIKFDNLETPGGGRIWGTAAYFDMALTNVRIVTTTPQGDPKIIQRDNTVEGAEAELGYSQPAGLGTFTTILTAFVASAIDPDGTLTPPGVPGQALESPEEVYSAFFTYTWDEGNLAGLSIGGSWRFEGSKPSRISAGTGYYHPEVDIFDAFIRYNYRENWTFSINGSNLSDEDSIHRAAATGLASRRNPREIEFSAAYRW